MLPFVHPLLRLLAIVGIALPCFAAEPFLRPHDVIAFVGGEDMVAMSEYGYLELLLVRALPDYQLRFRNLAWEGDTVFEQRRDLNFPPLEAQLDKVGATVVIVQFGQMESLAGKEKLPEFIAAYEKLIERIGGGGKRRIVLLTPHRFEDPPWGWSLATDFPTHEIDLHPTSRNEVAASYAHSIAELGGKLHCTVSNLWPMREDDDVHITRDGVHLNGTMSEGHGELAREVRRQFGVREIFLTLALYDDKDTRFAAWPTGAPGYDQQESLLALIRAKNRLWFNYWRPQNWAFLNGDRTQQPSSRDWRDPSKRWFPAEIEEFVPLIEAKEREIDALAVKLAKP